jgi:hypothetical protein
MRRTLAEPLIGEVVVLDVTLREKWRGHAVACVKR